VVVLPVGSISPVAGAVPTESESVSLALRAGEALATALEAGGAAGFAVRPAVAVAALGTLSESDVDALYEPLISTVLDPGQGGEISADAAARWRDVADRTDQRYFLVPRSLSITRLEPLRVRAVLDAWLVDAAAAMVLWHADVAAVNPHAPSGAAADVYGAALEDAIDAAAASLAARLVRLARTGSDDFEAAVP
jgi:hypothetical protein